MLVKLADGAIILFTDPERVRVLLVHRPAGSYERLPVASVSRGAAPYRVGLLPERQSDVHPGLFRVVSVIVTPSTSCSLGFPVW